MRLPKKFAQKSRKVTYFIHLWTGLLLGFWLVLMGLTGSILSWKSELMEWETRQRVSAPVPDPTAKKIPVSRAIAALKGFDPELNPGRGINVPVSDTGYYLYRTRNQVNGKRVTHIYVVHPVTAKVYPPVVLSTLWIDVTEQFHHNLLIGVKGTVTNGFFTFFTLFMLISGAWLWWPSNLKQFKQRIVLKRGVSLKRTLYDLHNIMGVYMYGLLFLVTLTGVIICYNGQTEQSIRNAINRSYGIADEPRRGAGGEGRGAGGEGRGGRLQNGEGGNLREPLPIDVLVEKAREAMPGYTLVSVKEPRRAGQPFQASYDYYSLTTASVPFDPYTGERLMTGGETAFGRAPSPGATFMGAIFNLHYGWFGGNWSKVLYCLSHWACLSLVFGCGLERRRCRPKTGS
jgi:uncharacterized iron-regulated membrane protein